MVLGLIGHILQMPTSPRLREVTPNLTIEINNMEEQIKSKATKPINKSTNDNKCKILY